MAFRVHWGTEDAPITCDDKDTYVFMPGGVLAVHMRSIKPQSTEYYAPGFWRQVSADPDHNPGGPKLTIT
jgi:hypothetical protein